MSSSLPPPTQIGVTTVWVSKRTHSVALEANRALREQITRQQAQLEAAAEAAKTATAAESPVVLGLQQDLAAAHKQIERQAIALTAYEQDHEQLNDDLRRLAEQRDKALAGVAS